MRKGQMDKLPPSDQENLERLYAAFGPAVSLEQIQSAYCQSGRNLYDAEKMLSGMQIRTRNCSSSSSGEGVALAKTKKHHTTFVGTVSGANGRDHSRQLPSSSTTGCWIRKPMVLNKAKVPVSNLEDENDYNGGSMRQEEIEGFLFEMLRDGLSLDKDTIHDILGQCGYDVKQTMDKLLNLSQPPTMEEKPEELLKSHSDEVLYRECSSSLPTTHRNNGRAQKKKGKRDLEQEILSSLFTAPERTINEPVKIPPVPVRSFVQGPLKESLIDYQPIISRKDTIEKNDETNENDYDSLRKAVSEFKTTMKEYYTAAAIAFGNQEFEKAQKLREEGDFYMKKSKEADDKSAKKLVERDDEEDLIYNLQEFEPEAAIRFLKVQLTSLAGFSSFKYLKAIVGNSDGQSKQASRKRRILRLLEKEHIKWSEEGDGWTIVINLSEVKPENLSFARK